MTGELTAALIALIGPAAGVMGYLVRRWLATERPFLATIQHQDTEIAALRRDLRSEREYVRLLVQALQAAGIDVPMPPAYTEAV